MARIALEDNFTDIISKAQRGQNLSDQALAFRAGVFERDLGRLRRGEVVEPVIRAVAKALQLCPAALLESARGEWYPEPVEVTGLAQVTTPYHDMTVNAYLAWDPRTKEAVVFDTGADCRPVLALVAQHQLHVGLILLTHSHTDHVSDLGRLVEATGAPAYSCEREPVRGAETFREGRAFLVGPLEVQTRLTAGHSAGGTTFLVSGLARPLAVVGDALFAGSMGGGFFSYTEAVLNNRKKILTLPDDTVLCPGHGPVTSVREEKAHNPFFPEFRAPEH